MHGAYVKIIILKSSGSFDIAIEIYTEFLYRSLQDLMWNWNWGKHQNICVPLQAFIAGVARMMDF
jgi:hypothetical protein